VRTCILALRKQKNITEKSTVLRELVYLKDDEVDVTKSTDASPSVLYNELDNWLTLLSLDISSYDILQKIREKSCTLSTYCEVSQGLIPYDKYRGHSEQTIKDRIWHSEIQKDKTYRKELKGGDVARYMLNWNGQLWISYGAWLAAPRNPKFFNQERILIREIGERSLYSTITAEEYYNTPSIINVIQLDKKVDLHYLLGIINSKLIGWFHYNTSPKAKKGLFPKILVNDVRNLPIIVVDNQKPMIDLVHTMLRTNEQIEILRAAYVAHLQQIFGTTLLLNKKINDWQSSTWQELLAELRKQKRTLLPKQESITKTEFERVKQLIQHLQVVLVQTDTEIDAKVCELYELTPEEIASVTRT
jgi:hypothetical protein